MPSIARSEPLRAGAIVGRVAFGFVGATANALALFATVMGAVVRSIHDQGHGTRLAPCFHLGYAATNAVLMAFLLAGLGDGTRRAVPIATMWTAGSLILWTGYWSWVL